MVYGQRLAVKLRAADRQSTARWPAPPDGGSREARSCNLGALRDKADGLAKVDSDLDRAALRARSRLTVVDGQWDETVAAFGRAVVDASGGRRDQLPYARFFPKAAPSLPPVSTSRQRKCPPEAPATTSRQRKRAPETSSDPFPCAEVPTRTCKRQLQPADERPTHPRQPV